MNVGRGALRLWVVFTVLWISAVGFVWQATVEGSIQNGCYVATYIEQLSRARSAPTAKLRVAALCHLFDWMGIGQIMPTNPAAAVRGPRHIVRRGKTPVLDPVEARQLLANADWNFPKSAA